MEGDNPWKTLSTVLTTKISSNLIPATPGNWPVYKKNTECSVGAH